MSAALEAPEVVRGEIVPYEAPAPVTLFRTEQPDEVVARATDTAKALSRVVKKQKLTVAIQGRDHVKVEGWTLLGTMLGVFPVCVWTRQLADGWEARVEARTLAGHLVGAAEAQCLRSERTWASRDDYALRSMAQTRATSKALRQPLGFVMTLAGFDATPFEEMPTTTPDTPPAEPPLPSEENKATSAQHAKLAAAIRELVEKAPIAEGLPGWGDQLKRIAKDKYGVTSRANLTKSQMSDLIETCEGWLKDQQIPF